jgi:hypothetical protein
MNTRRFEILGRSGATDVGRVPNSVVLMAFLLGVGAGGRGAGLPGPGVAVLVPDVIVERRSAAPAEPDGTGGSRATVPAPYGADSDVAVSPLCVSRPFVSRPFVSLLFVSLLFVSLSFVSLSFVSLLFVSLSLRAERSNLHVVWHRYTQELASLCSQ